MAVGRRVIRADLAGDAWTLAPISPGAPVSGPIPARVPGCVHADLERAGLAPSIDDRAAERELAWIGRTDWRYARRLELPEAMGAHERVELVLDGLDTFATVRAGARELGRAASAFVPWRFPLDPAVDGIAVDLAAPVRAIERLEREHGRRPVNGDWGPYAYARKPACHFGWDWGPMAPTAGISAAQVEAWSIARLEHVRPLVREAAAARAILDVHVDPVRASNAPLEVHVVLRDPDGAVVAERRADPGRGPVRLEVERPRRWWPRERGPQDRYRLEVALRAGGVELDAWSGQVGLRTVRRLGENGDGTFGFAVNGEPLFARGVNWIPATLFPPADRARVERLLDEAVAANLTMIRVWGGGQYEPSSFHDACDERGLLVWQDFMFACATYPEHAAFADLVEREARHQVARLARHPSLVLWCGGNENLLAWDSWGWRDDHPDLAERGERYWLGSLPAITAALDPSRPYWPDSPFSGAREIHPNDPDRGDRHTWDARVEGYRASVPRFCSEFGHQAPPAVASLREALGEAGLDVASPALQDRQRAWGGHVAQYDGPLDEHFTRPTDFDGWHARAQLLQARAVEIGITWLRAQQPRCRGALLWQLGDVWTAPTWSVIDARGRRKPAWYALRRACAPRLLTIQPGAGGVVLVAVNETRAPWSLEARVRRCRFDGTVLEERAIALAAGADGVAASGPLPALGEPSRELLVADADGHRAWWFAGPDRDLACPEPALSIERTGPGAYRLRAESLLRDVVLQVDRVAPGARVSDQLLTLLPGECAAFRVGGADPEPAALARWPVLACANRFGGPPGGAVSCP